MKKSLLNIISKGLLLVLALQIFNLSVNGSEFKPFFTGNFTEFNEINSITEFVSEIVLGHTNAFPEMAKKAQKQSQIQKHISIKIFKQENFYETTNFVLIKSPYVSPIKGFNLADFAKEINPPPPKA